MNLPRFEYFSFTARLLGLVWLVLAPVVAGAFQVPVTSVDATEEIVIADFESESYGDWVATGTAFGPGPAVGTLPNQMPVSRYRGQRLVNSFFGGDDSVGTLQSPPFTLSKSFLHFLVGGGGWGDQTSVNLIVDGQVVMNSTGFETEAGGSETLVWTTWDVADYRGREATIQLVDDRRGGWGHILADQFVLSDQPSKTATIRREIEVTGRYLHIPVKTGAPKVWLQLMRGDQEVRRFEVELAEGEPDFVAVAQVQPWLGETLTVNIERSDLEPRVLEPIVSADVLPNEAAIFSEPTRPAFHFTSKIGWLNDPNGLVYHNGTWHLFYQHNPFGWNWGNMHWGHATSTDLFNWVERGDKIHPWADAVGAAFSGSGLIDHENTSHLGEGDVAPLIFPFTDTAIGESLAYSNDGGETLKIFAGNPVVKHTGRDPKVIWHQPTSRWVMAVYTEADDQQWIAFHSSENLIDWKYESRIEGFYECPDFFELSIDDPVVDTDTQGNLSRWVLYGADGQYMLGDFDGRVFTPHHEGKHQVWYGDFYAAQTYSDAPADRRVQIGWGRGIQFPGQRFNQQMCVPVELSLRPTAVGLRMFARPVAELQAYAVPLTEFSLSEIEDEPTLIDLPAPWRMELTLKADSDGVAMLDIGGAPLTVDMRAGTIQVAEITAPLDLKTTPGQVKLDVLVDRGSIEVFVNDGAIAISKAWLYGRDPVVMKLNGVNSRINSLNVKTYQLRIDR